MTSRPIAASSVAQRVAGRVVLRRARGVALGHQRAHLRRWAPSRAVASRSRSSPSTCVPRGEQRVLLAVGDVGRTRSSSFTTRPRRGMCRSLASASRNRASKPVAAVPSRRPPAPTRPCGGGAASRAGRRPPSPPTRSPSRCGTGSGSRASGTRAGRSPRSTRSRDTHDVARWTSRSSARTAAGARRGPRSPTTWWPTAPSDCAISSSWCGNRRSVPPVWMSKRSPRYFIDIAEHSTCQPGKPSPHGRRPLHQRGPGRPPSTARSRPRGACAGRSRGRGGPRGGCPACCRRACP